MKLVTWDIKRAHVIQEAGRKQEFESALAEAEGADLKGGALDKACDRLMQIVSDTAHDLAEAGQYTRTPF